MENLPVLGLRALDVEKVSQLSDKLPISPEGAPAVRPVQLHATGGRGAVLLQAVPTGGVLSEGMTTRQAADVGRRRRGLYRKQALEWSRRNSIKAQEALELCSRHCDTSRRLENWVRCVRSGAHDFGFRVTAQKAILLGNATKGARR